VALNDSFMEEFACMAQEQRVCCNLSWSVKCLNFNHIVRKALH